MKTAGFITRQHVKYYIKVLATGGKQQRMLDRMENDKESFWQYEQTPRTI